MKTWGITKPTAEKPYGNEIVVKPNTVTEEGVTQTTSVIAVQEGLEALRTQIDCNLQVVKGEVGETDAGVDYFGIIFANTPLALKVQEITRVIMRCKDVNTVKYEKCEIDRVNNSLTFYFSIESVYGEFDYNKTFETLA